LAKSFATLKGKRITDILPIGFTIMTSALITSAQGRSKSGGGYAAIKTGSGGAGGTGGGGEDGARPKATGWEGVGRHTWWEGAGRHTFSKVLSIVTLYMKYTRALTVENVEKERQGEKFPVFRVERHVLAENA
jgi:hypothetical protein